MAFWLFRGFILLQLFVLSVSDKMVCSKFRCQEELLDKLVRMEFEVERFSKSLKERYDEMDELKNAARTELRQLQYDREAWKAEIETLKTKTQSIETIKNEIDELNGSKAEFRQLLQNDRESWKAEIETLKTESIETIKKQADFSQVYIRWGRKVCPGDAHLIYHGYAAGSHNTHSGGAADTQCLPRDPQWGNVYHGQSATSYIYGAEYQTGIDGSKSIFGENIHDQDVPCAVCEVKGRTTLKMFPARTSCYKGWHLEYNGYMMTTYQSENRANVKCVDANPEVILGQGRNSNGDLFYFIEAAGQLPTYTYPRGKMLTCVVCTK